MSNQVEASKPQAEPPTIRLRNILIVVLPVAALAVALLVSIFVVDTDALLDDLNRAEMAPAGGQVLFQGQPLHDGVVMTQPLESRGRPAMGVIDKEGKFSLSTDIRGKLVEGATVGEHRVTVTAYQNVSLGGPGVAPLAIPPQYASFQTSPLRITIGENPEENQFKFVLEGEAPPRAKERPPARQSPPAQAKQPAEDAKADEDAADAKAEEDAGTAEVKEDAVDQP